MTTSKYIRNSAIHRTLESICMAPSAAVYLRPKITQESMSRFMEYCINPLVADEFIVKKGDVYESTEDGRNYLAQLGPTKKRMPHRKPVTLSEREIYVEGKFMPVRPGAADHNEHPSLVGNIRKWRDGRMEVIDDRQAD